MIDRSRPLPSPVGLVLKNGCYSLSLMSAGMPVPLSRTWISTTSPASMVVTFSVGSNPASPPSRARRSPTAFRRALKLNLPGFRQ